MFSIWGIKNKKHKKITAERIRRQGKNWNFLLRWAYTSNFSCAIHDQQLAKSIYTRSNTCDSFIASNKIKVRFTQQVAPRLTQKVKNLLCKVAKRLLRNYLCWFSKDGPQIESSELSVPMLCKNHATLYISPQYKLAQYLTVVLLLFSWFSSLLWPLFHHCFSKLRSMCNFLCISVPPVNTDPIANSSSAFCFMVLFFYLSEWVSHRVGHISNFNINSLISSSDHFLTEIEMVSH